MAIVLIDWAELSINFFLNEIRWHHESLNSIVLLVLFQINVLIERSEGLWETKWVPHTFDSGLTTKFLLVAWGQKMISQWLNGQKTLKARIKVAEVRVVLQTYYSLGQLFSGNLLRLFLLFFLDLLRILSWPLDVAHVNHAWSTC